jgi:tetratricopeptide (TPR) repeat protein
MTPERAGRRMSPEDRPTDSPTEELLLQGIAAVREKRRGEARRCLQQVLALDPSNEGAWLWLARIATDPRSALAYFSQVLMINPQNQRAMAGFTAARAKLAEKDNPSPASSAIERGSDTLSVLAPLSTFLKSRTLRQRSGQALLFGLIGLALLALLVANGWATGLGQAAWNQWIATSTPTPTPTPTPVPTPTPTNEQLMAPLWSKLHGAWEAQTWGYVIELLDQIRNIDPANADAEEKLFAAHFNFATQLVKDGQLEEAVTHFDQALSLRPEYLPAQEARELAVTYLMGLESYHQGSWVEAIASLEKVYQKDQSYQEVRSLLYEAHWRQGAALQEGGQLTEALGEYRRALDIMPYGTEATTRRVAVTALLKHIEVDVSQQRLTAWNGDKLVYSFVCSTGKSGTPTKYGRFSVLSKMPEAYGSAWDLRMPYWLGIYWAGGSQNGIHGLPILSSGQTLWSGYLGQPISYGCIVLDTWAAKQLYDWAEIGTEVIIHE